jgi:hypothetical protein
MAGSDLMKIQTKHQEYSFKEDANDGEDARRFLKD